MSTTFHKFSESDKRLQRLISSQRIGNSKIGLGFEQGESSNQPRNATIFVKGEETKDKISVSSMKSSVSTKSIMQEKGYVRQYPHQTNNYPVRRYVRRFVKRYPNQYQKGSVRLNSYTCFCLQ